MIALVNTPWEDAVVFTRAVEDAAREHTPARRGRHLYVLTCYYDLDGITEIVAAAARGLEAADGHLRAVSVVVDVAEWIGNRHSKRRVVSAIREASGLDDDDISFVPVQVERGRLLHAKAVGLISTAETKGELRGVLLATSANATKRGSGLDKKSNVEFVALDSRPESLRQFVSAFGKLVACEVSPEEAAKQDRFLRALMLLRAGTFYHKWEGSLASAVRFKLDLTPAGREARNSRAMEFGDYEPDSDSVSRDPLGIEAIFDAVPKAFPDSFWRTYSVDTLLGKWVPQGIADIVDGVLNADIEPYLAQIGEMTSSANLDAVCVRLTGQVQTLRRRGWIKNKVRVVDSWRERVERFAEDTDLIKLRIHPYERVPELLDAQNKAIVLRTYNRLEARVERNRRPAGLYRVLAGHFAGELTPRRLRAAFKELASDAASSLGVTQGK